MNCVSRLAGRVGKTKIIEFYDRMSKRFDVKIIEKKNSQLMILVSWLLGMLHFFWKSVPSRKEFMEDYSTTFFNRFYIRSKVGDSKEISYNDHIYLLLHEFRHVEQFRGSLFMPFEYLLDSDARALYEAHACYTRINMAWEHDYECSDEQKYEIFSTWAEEKAKQWEDFYGCKKESCEKGKEYLILQCLLHMSHEPKKVELVDEAVKIFKDMGVL